MKQEILMIFADGSRLVRMIDENGRLFGHQYVPVLKKAYKVNGAILSKPLY